MYLLHVGLGVNFTQIGRFFHRDRSTAAHACKVVETRRDDPDVDATIAMLQLSLDVLVRRKPLVQRLSDGSRPCEVMPGGRHASIQEEALQ